MSVVTLAIFFPCLSFCQHCNEVSPFFCQLLLIYCDYTSQVQETCHIFTFPPCPGYALPSMIQPFALLAMHPSLRGCTNTDTSLKYKRGQPCFREFEFQEHYMGLFPLLVRKKAPKALALTPTRWHLQVFVAEASARQHPRPIHHHFRKTPTPFPDPSLRLALVAWSCYTAV